MAQGLAPLSSGTTKARCRARRKALPPHPARNAAVIKAVDHKRAPATREPRRRDENSSARVSAGPELNRPRRKGPPGGPCALPGSCRWRASRPSSLGSPPYRVLEPASKVSWPVLVRPVQVRLRRQKRTGMSECSAPSPVTRHVTRSKCMASARAARGGLPTAFSSTWRLGTLPMEAFTRRIRSSGTTPAPQF